MYIEVEDNNSNKISLININHIIRVIDGGNDKSKLFFSDGSTIIVALTLVEMKQKIDNVFTKMRKTL